MQADIFGKSFRIARDDNPFFGLIDYREKAKVIKVGDQQDGIHSECRKCQFFSLVVVDPRPVLQRPPVCRSQSSA
jgi:hypothetical protein